MYDRVNDERLEFVPLSPKKAVAPDPARSLALLWGSHTKAGRSGLTVRSIVDTAIELARTHLSEARRSVGS